MDLPGSLRFFTAHASEILSKPLEAESPVWLFGDPVWALPDPGTHRLQIEIPKEEVLLFDRRKWNRILNLSYVGTKEEEQEFDARMKSKGSWMRRMSLQSPIILS